MMRSLSPSALMQRKNQQQQQEEEQKRKQEDISHRPVSQLKPIPPSRRNVPKGGQSVTPPKKPLLPPTHNRSISAEFSSQSLPTSPVPTSTESLRPLSNVADCVEPDYDEPDVSAARESMQLCYAYVDLVGSNRSLPTEHCSCKNIVMLLHEYQFQTIRMQYYYTSMHYFCLQQAHPLLVTRECR